MSKGVIINKLKNKIKIMSDPLHYAIYLEGIASNNEFYNILSSIIDQVRLETLKEVEEMLFGYDGFLDRIEDYTNIRMDGFKKDIKQSLDKLK